LYVCTNTSQEWCPRIRWVEMVSALILEFYVRELTTLTGYSSSRDVSLSS
jgi:hypothetical protein